MTVSLEKQTVWAENNLKIQVCASTHVLILEEQWLLLLNLDSVIQTRVRVRVVSKAAGRSEGMVSPASESAKVYLWMFWGCGGQSKHGPSALWGRLPSGPCLWRASWEVSSLWDTRPAETRSQENETQDIKLLLCHSFGLTLVLW